MRERSSRISLRSCGLRSSHGSNCMVTLKAAEAERFIDRPDPTKAVVLVFGADAGLVAERVEALIAKSVDDPADPFQLARLDGDALARDPGRLSEEANTIPLFG